MIIALALVLVLTMLIAGTAMVSEVQLSASKSERDYERALMMAEAGVNAYVNMLENGAGTGSNAAYIPPVYTFTASSPEPTLAQFRTGVENGTYTVIRYPANSQQGYFVGQTTGSGGALTISGYGWSNGIVRRTSVNVAPSSGSAVSGYALFAGNKGIFTGSEDISGSIGTNGQFTMNGSNTVTQDVVFNGPGSGWSSLNGSNSFGGVITNSTAVAWPTVETLANQDFPLGGLGYLALVNDNLLSGILLNTLSLSGSGTFTFNSKAGGVNYYLTSMTFNGSYNIFFNNTLGPINIWIGPSGSNGAVTLNGASSAVSMSANPAYACKIYDASNGSITLNGSSTLNVGIYSINNAGTSTVRLNGSDAINTSIIANNLMSNGSSTVNYTSGYFAAPAASSLFISSGWTELD
jgi:hypothetical protein